MLFPYLIGVRTGSICSNPNLDRESTIGLDDLGRGYRPAYANFFLDCAGEEDRLGIFTPSRSSCFNASI